MEPAPAAVPVRKNAVGQGMQPLERRPSWSARVTAAGGTHACSRSNDSNPGSCWRPIWRSPPWQPPGSNGAAASWTSPATRGSCRPPPRPQRPPISICRRRGASGRSARGSTGSPPRGPASRACWPGQVGRPRWRRWSRTLRSARLRCRPTPDSTSSGASAMWASPAAHRGPTSAQPRRGTRPRDHDPSSWRSSTRVWIPHIPTLPRTSGETPARFQATTATTTATGMSTTSTAGTSPTATPIRWMTTATARTWRARSARWAATGSAWWVSRGRCRSCRSSS